MKATLTIGASRLTTDLTIDRLNTVLETFIAQIDDQVSECCDDDAADPDEDTSFEELASMEDDSQEREPLAAPLPPSAPKRLYHFRCPSCSRTPFIAETEIKPGDTIDCHCGKVIDVFHVREASGSCPKCGQSFWRIGMINRLDVIVCKKCRSAINLVDVGGGQLGTGRR